MYRHGLCGVCGVYLITNNVNHKRYVGSSVNVGSRVNQHFGTAMRRYMNINEMYSEFHDYGRNNFTITLLEKCGREEKLDRERYWYDKIKPEYNLVPPDATPFTHEEVKRKALEAYLSPEVQKRVREYHRTEEYRQKTREAKRNKMVGCKAIDKDGNETVFDSMSDAARWLNRKSALCSVVSNIKTALVRNGSAFGYRWEVV